MIFEATEEQVRRLFAVAVNASRSVGLGFLHYDNREYIPEEFEEHDLARGLDYHAGRMVKLWVTRMGPGRWSLPDGLPRPDWQSWCGRYPTYPDLLRAAGIAVSP
jgi:hypothetical protein